MPQFTSGRGDSLSGNPVAPGSIKSGWVTAIADARGTAQSSAELVNPLSVTSTNITALAIPDGTTRIEIVGRFPGDTSAIATSPVIRVYAVWAPRGLTAADQGASIAWPAGTRARRIDATTAAAAGITLTYSIGATTLIRDGTGASNWYYTDPVAIDVDMRGATHLLVLLNTAASITQSGGVAPVDVLMLN